VRLKGGIVVVNCDNYTPARRLDTRSEAPGAREEIYSEQAASGFLGGAPLDVLVIVRRIWMPRESEWC
jgi:hypothetical protein